MEPGKLTAESLRPIEEEIEAYVAEEKTSSRNLARKKLFSEIKDNLSDLFPDAVKGVDLEKAKVEDVLKNIAEKAKVAPAAAAGEGSGSGETEAQIRARIESENKAVIKAELEKVRRKGFLAQVLGDAKAEGLDPVYADAMLFNFEKEFGIDLSKDEPILLKNDEPFYINGKPAGTMDAVKELFGKYSAFKKTAARTPDPAAAVQQQGTQVQGQQGQVQGNGLGRTWEEDLLKDMPGMKKFVSSAPAQ